jgi:HEAT repeat protein
MSEKVMNLSFCDLCNESIPQADLDLGRAVRRNERLICAACESAMSGAHSRPPAESLPVAPVSAARSEAPPSSPVAAVALAFASVALVVGVGLGAYLFWRLEGLTSDVSRQVGDLERSAPEHARTVAASLAEEARVREGELTETRAALAGLTARMQELEHAGEQTAALERRLDKFDARLGAIDDLSSRVQHQSGALEKLAVTVAELGAAQAREKQKEPPVRVSEPAKPAAAAPVAPLASAPGGALWEKWVADLTSPDSGTRWQAVQSLGGTKDAAVVPHLVPMLADADIFVRMAACRHLGDLGSIEAIPGLIDTLEDDEASVREAALVALRSLSGQAIPFDPLARDGDRSKRVKDWREWWEKSSKDLLERGKEGKPKG